MKYQFRRTQADINLAAIAQNIREHQRLIGPHSSLMAVVKANGYGHGAIPVLKTAIENGVTWAGVSSVEEAIQIRESGISIPILLMGGWYPEAVPAIMDYRIIPSVFSQSLANELNRQAKSRNQKIKVHLKLETGMGRLGFLEPQLIDFLAAITTYENLEIDGVFSHLSSADEEDQTFTSSQLSLFMRLLAHVQRSREVPWIHISNSAGISSIKEGGGNLYRLGIAMYGQPTSPYQSKLDLREAITWKSAIVHMQKYPRGYPISYNKTYHTRPNALIATVCVGYADGYPRLLSNKGFALVRGRRVPIVGRVCMDMLMVDVTEIDQVSVYDEVVLIGRQGSSYISANEMASWAGTINYEIICGISGRVPRHYHH